MVTGKTLKIFVMGKEPRSLKKVELSNWNGIAFIGRRTQIDHVNSRSELKEPTIYMLLSDKSDQAGLIDIYIGEAEDFSSRLKQHIKDESKSWFEQFIAFVVADQSLTKAHVKYLESELCKLANKSVGMLRTKNGNTPPGASLPESDMASMNEFLENIIFVLESLGLSYFQQNPGVIEEIYQNDSSNNLNNMIFTMTLPKEVSIKDNEALKGQMTVKNGTYILNAGSYIRSEANESFKGHAYYELWSQIINSDAVSLISGAKVAITTRDIEFNAPSGAGAIVRARATNGRTEWKRMSDNKPLYECELE